MNHHVSRAELTTQPDRPADEPAVNGCRATACEEYYSLSRRGFLGVVGGAAGGVAIATISPAWLPKVAIAKDYRSGQRDVLVSVYLRGACDGLTMLAPFTEAGYLNARPNVRMTAPDSGLANATLAINNSILPSAAGGNVQFGLAPALAPLLPAYNAGRLLFVHATGSTDSSRSHFEAQRYMEIGKPGESTLFSGWLGRHLGSVAPMQANSLLRGIGIATGLQQTLVGGPQTLPIPDLDTFGLTGNSSSATARRGVLQNLYSGVGEPLYSVGLSTLQTIDLLNTINFVGYTPGGGAVYPNGGLGTAFKQTAALIRAQVGVEAIAIDYGGWDTHTNQGNTSGGTMFSLMNTLAQAMAAFNLDLSSGAAPSTTTVVMSEFGRRLQENGSLGTDHGHGNVMFVMGPCVNGGRILANWPGMGPAQLYQGIDLNVTIDFRDILAEVVQNRLGNNNLATVFPDFTPTVRGVLSC